MILTKEHQIVLDRLYERLDESVTIKEQQRIFESIRKLLDQSK